MLLSISAPARAGKNTFAALLTQYLNSWGDTVKEVAFADSLKAEIDPLLRTKYGISAWTQDSAEKAIIRPDLVELGKRRRDESNGMYWVLAVEPTVIQYLDAGYQVLVTDARYPNEIEWVKSLGGKSIYLERLLSDGTPVKPANSEEALFDPQAKACVDLVVQVPTFGSDYLTLMRPYVERAWAEVTK